MKNESYYLKFHQKLLLRMKLIVITMCFCILQVSATNTTMGQNLNLQIKDQTIREVFRAIESQTHYRFFFNDIFNDLNRVVSVDANNSSVKQVLDELLGSSRVSYKILEDNLVVIAPVSELQQKTVTGTITDASSGEALPGVNVVIKGSTQGTISDLQGNFSLEISDPGAVLVFSYVGYNTEEVTVQNNSKIIVSLIPDIKALEEVVVIGYGTIRKADVTSSISSVKSDNFVKGAVKDAAQLIQGKVSGLTVSTPSGNPTEGTQIMLRGITTIMSSTDPLILVDGIPGSLNTVAPEDVEAIDVLKDGSAAAIYGTRGTNGVILITTKRAGKNIKPTLEYSTYVSLQTIARKMDFLNAADYRRLIAEGIDFEDFGGSTDWFKEVSRTPVSHSHNLMYQGGNNNSNYTASINYKDSEGIFKRSDSKQLIGRIDINHVMFEGKLKFNLSGLFRNSTYWTGSNDVNNFNSSFNNGIYRQAIIRNPTDMVKDSDGNWQERDTYMYDNPVGLLRESDGEITQRENRLNGSVIWSPIKDLNIKLLTSGTQYNQLRGYAETKKHSSNTKYGKNGFASRSTDASKDKLLEITTDYSKSLNNHRITILGGYSYQDESSESFYMQNWDFPTDLYSYNNMTTGDALSRGEAQMSSYKQASKLIGFFGRLNYSFDEKYLLMASLRREGSTKFGKNYQWGDFSAVSIGWRLSNENFMKSITFIDNLKLRAGFGVTGTIPTWPYLSQVSLTYQDRFLDNGKWIQGIEPVRNENPNLRWEKKEELNMGIDFSFYQGRINGNVDVYKRNTKDMLYDYPVPVPPYLYSSITANVGEMENKGLEVYVQLVPVKNPNFNWTTNITYSTNKNKLVSLSNDQFKMTNDYFDTGYTGEPIQTVTHRVKIGGPIGNFWGYKAIDIDTNGEWIVESKDGTPISIKDASDVDKKVLGNGLPKYYLGWNNTFQYKNFDLSLNMRGAFGFQILNFQRMYYENPKITEYNMLKTAFDKVYGKAVLNSDLAFVSYYIEDGDYLKLDNATIGYTFHPKNEKIMKKFRIYASGLNLLTITDYKGVDPEVNRMGLNPGDDERDKYPTTRIFTVGLNVTF